MPRRKSSAQLNAEIATSLAARQTWDPSAFGLTRSELSGMDEEERQEALSDALNRAADLLQASASAFRAELGPLRSKITDAADTVIARTRR